MTRRRPSKAYVLIESHDCVDPEELGHLCDLATFILRTEGQVTVLFVQEGVFAALSGSTAARLGALRHAGVRFLADGSSLLARGLSTDDLAPWVASTDAESSVQTLIEGRRPLWITDRRPRQAA